MVVVSRQHSLVKSSLTTVAHDVSLFRVNGDDVVNFYHALQANRTPDPNYVRALDGNHSSYACSRARLLHSPSSGVLRLSTSHSASACLLHAGHIFAF